MHLWDIVARYGRGYMHSHYPISTTQVGIFNNCDKCMTAAIAWCDASIKRVSVPPHDGVVINMCVGQTTMIGESPCGPAGASSNEPAESSSKQRLTYVSPNAASSEDLLAPKARACCSANNDQGDKTCSICCPPGQATSCQHAWGFYQPVCQCK